MVELTGDFFELIAAPDLDAVVELASADALRAFAEHGQRAHHLAADQEGDQECHGQCGQREKGGAQKRCQQRGISFRRRLLHDH